MTGRGRHYLVYQFGTVWQLTHAAYRRMLVMGSQGKSFDLDNMRGSRVVGVVDAGQVVDWERDSFKEKLEELPRKAPRPIRCNCPLACALHDAAL